MDPYGKILTLENLLANFPAHLAPTMTPNQRQALELIAGGRDTDAPSLTLEMPTGSGKTAVGYTMLRTLASAGVGPLFYIVPTKALVDQVAQMHPELTAVYGRGEYDCLYYEPHESFKADEIPCLSLRDCSHRVDQETGKPLVEGATPCPYYRAKFRAKQAPITVCTASFYLFTQLFSREFEPALGLVVDEAHQISEIFRNALSYEITDWHLGRSIDLLAGVGAENAAIQLDEFLRVMVTILKRRQKRPDDRLLKDEELLQLTDQLEAIDLDAIRRTIDGAVKSGEIDPLRDRLTLQQLETVARNLPRYIRSLEYARQTGERNALNFVTYGYSEKSEDELVKYRLIIKANYVVPLVRKLLSPMTLAYSATIGDPTVFGYETGIKARFASLPATFPAENTRVMMPADTPDLAAARKIRQEPTKVLRKVAKLCGRAADSGARSLVVVVSNAEREKFLWLCGEEGVDAISYGNGVPSREALTRFKAGEGSVLVGTAANYGAGIDLPQGIAPVAVFLRPSYPNPKDPRAQFELRRYGKSVWMVWNWRAMIEALQVRGRNIRGADDRGVTIFVSQQFRRFLYGSLPEWLRPSYDGKSSLAECEEQAMELLADE